MNHVGQQVHRCQLATVTLRLSPKRSQLLCQTARGGCRGGTEDEVPGLHGPHAQAPVPPSEKPLLGEGGGVDALGLVRESPVHVVAQRAILALLLLACSAHGARQVRLRGAALVPP